MMRTFLMLIAKDVRTELRGKESISLLFGLAVLLSLIGMFGVGSAFLSPEYSKRMYPGLVWLIFLFAGTSCVGRSFEADLQGRAIEALLVAKINPSVMYVSKVLVFSVILFLGHAVTCVLFAGLIEVSIMAVFLSLLLVSALVVFAFTSIAVLLAAISAVSRMKGMLLPLLVLPLTFPLLAAAIELFQAILQNGALQLDSIWLTLLVVADVLYFILGLNLFSFAIRE